MPTRTTDPQLSATQDTGTTDTVTTDTVTDDNSVTARWSPIARPLFAVTGPLIGIAVILVVVGVAVSSSVLLVVGVVLGVGTTFVLASREMGDHKAS